MLLVTLALVSLSRSAPESITAKLTSHAPTKTESLRWSPKGATVTLAAKDGTLAGSFTLGGREPSTFAVRLEKTPGAAHFDVLWLDRDANGAFDEVEKLTTTPSESRSKWWSSFESELTLRAPAVEGQAASSRPYPLSLWFVEDPAEPDAPPALRWSRRGWHEGECVIAGKPAFVLVTEMEMDGVFDQRDSWFLARDRDALLKAMSRSLEGHAWLDGVAYRPTAIDPFGRSVAFESFDPGFTEAPEEAAKADTLAPDRNAPRAEKPLPFGHDHAAALAQAKKDHKRVLVDFETTWCGSVQDDGPTRLHREARRRRGEGSRRGESRPATITATSSSSTASPPIRRSSSSTATARAAPRRRLPQCRGDGGDVEAVTVVATFLLATAALGQSPSIALNSRFEVLRRLRAAETCWSMGATPEQKASALPHFRSAQSALSADRMSECARELDLAIGAFPRCSMSNAFATFARTPERRLFDTSCRSFRVRFEPLYGIGAHDQPLNACDFVAGFRRGALECGRSRSHEVQGHWTSPDRDFVIDATLAEHADETLWSWVWDGDWECSKSSLTVSFVERRDERLAALETAIDAAREKALKLELASLERQVALLNSLARGSTEAHDYPGARLLAEAEQVVAAAAKGERWYGPERDGEFFLALPIAERAIPTRVFVPPGMTKETPAPLVLALHGAVFDEDTWFDGYGGGQAKALCAERGWMLAAPRCDGVEDAAKIDALAGVLAERYPIDTARVFLVGHSLRGRSALIACSQDPTRYRGVATIGAMLHGDAAPSLATATLFLAAGESDFAREGVEGFHKSLLAAGSKTATLHIYPQTEHWLAVTDALPDVFAWLDELAK